MATYYPRKSPKHHQASFTDLHSSSKQWWYHGSFHPQQFTPILTTSQAQQAYPAPSSQATHYPPPGQTSPPPNRTAYSPPPAGTAPVQNFSHRTSYSHHSISSNPDPSTPPNYAQPPPSAGFTGHSSFEYPPEKANARALDTSAQGNLDGGAPAATHFVGASTTQDDVGTFNGGSYRISHRDSNTILTLQLAMGCPLLVKPGRLLLSSLQGLEMGIV